jgi:hypothetical protein
MAERGTSKQRNSNCYQKKVNNITNWYNRLLKFREETPEKINKNTKQATKRKELKPLKEYTDKIKKPQGENK